MTNTENDTMAITAFANSYKTGEPCEWTTPVDKVSGHYMHLLDHEEGIEICINDKYSEKGCYIAMTTADLSVLIDTLTSIRNSQTS